MTKRVAPPTLKVVLAVWCAAGAVPQSDGIARSAQMEKGASIRGAVTSGGVPLAEAEVSLQSSTRSELRSTRTDENGSYEFAGLPAGSYIVTAEKPGYISLRYGQTARTRLSQPVTLSEFTSARGVDLDLPPAARLAGRVSDQVGNAVAAATVIAMQLGYFEGARRFVPVGVPQQTDELGEFRFGNLEAGEYTLFAWQRKTWISTDGKKLCYRPSWYPGVSESEAAAGVTLLPGQSVDTADVVLTVAPCVRITGRVIDSSGRIASGASVAILYALRGRHVSTMQIVSSATASTNGEYTLDNVPAGTYRLEAALHSRNGLGATEAAVSRVDAFDNLVDFDISTTATWRLVGQIAMPSAANREISRQLTVAAESATPDLIPRLVARQSTGKVTPEGTFELSGLFGAQYISVVSIPDGWALESIKAAGIDLTDAPLEPKASASTQHVLITMTDTFGDLAGEVVDGRGRPRAQTAVVAFSPERRHWHRHSRFLRTALTDPRGRFQFRAIAPGSYYVASANTSDIEELTSPGLLSSLAAEAIRLHVPRGESKYVRLEAK